MINEIQYDVTIIFISNTSKENLDIIQNIDKIEISYSNNGITKEDILFKKIRINNRKEELNKEFEELKVKLKKKRKDLDKETAKYGNCRRSR